MSKKIKVSSDKKAVYLELDDISECCFELWELANEKRSTVKIKIPLISWEKIIKKWKKTKKLKENQDGTL